MVWDPKKKVFISWHVTNDAESFINAVKTKTVWGDSNDDFGPGAYASAVPQYWAGRATNRWEIMENMSKENRQKIVDLIKADPRYQPNNFYLTQWENEHFFRQLNYWLEDGKDYHLITISGQPYNPMFIKLARQIGLEGPRAQIVAIEFTGKYIDLSDGNWYSKRKEAEAKGYDGGYASYGFAYDPQIVIWNLDKITDVYVDTSVDVDYRHSS
jgi:hypothetical protein